jgi:hypothetical protein
LDSIDFDNLEKLSACEIGYDEDNLDLVLRVTHSGQEYLNQDHSHEDDANSDVGNSVLHDTVGFQPN